VRIYNPQEKKLDPRTISRYFIGYAEKSKGYRFYCPSHNARIMESRNAKFLENDLISGSDWFQYIAFKKDHYEAQPSISSDRLVVIHVPQVQVGVRQPIVEVPLVVEDDHVDQVVNEEQQANVEQLVEQQVPQQDNETTLRRSTRVKMSVILSDYQVYLQEPNYNIGAENDPETFSLAMSSTELNLWYNAMKDEMDFMASNRVWDLVEFPNGVNAIACRWVFKTKKDSQGNIGRHKAKLVAKWFTQRGGIDYKETFSLVSKKYSLWVIMTLVSHFDLELHQMDVKKLFLNGDLDEEFYMKQLEGFISSDCEHLVYKLNKSIYGLK